MVRDFFFLCHCNSTDFLYDVSVVFFKKKWGFSSTMADFLQINLFYRSDLYGPCSKVSCQIGLERRSAPQDLFPFNTWETEPKEVK